MKKDNNDSKISDKFYFSSESDNVCYNLDELLIEAKEDGLKEDLKNSREAVVSELDKFALEIKLQRNSFENSKSNFYKNMEENLKILFEKSFSNLKILVISNITLSLIIFTYLFLQ